jgi:hypothetical protein
MVVMLGEEYKMHDVPALEIAFHNIVGWYGFHNSLTHLFDLI